MKFFVFNNGGDDDDVFCCCEISCCCSGFTFIIILFLLLLSLLLIGRVEFCIVENVPLSICRPVMVVDVMTFSLSLLLLLRATFVLFVIELFTKFVTPVAEVLLLFSDDFPRVCND